MNDTLQQQICEYLRAKHLPAKQGQGEETRQTTQAGDATRTMGERIAAALDDSRRNDSHK